MNELKVRARAAAPSDYPQFLRLFAELQIPDEPPGRERWERTFMPETLIFELQGTLLAYAFMETLAEIGYVRQLVVEPRARGRGIGHAAMRELKCYFRARGCNQICLNVVPQNTRAIHVYEAAGMRVAYRSIAIQLAWAEAANLPEALPNLEARPLPRARDAAAERRFQLPRGMIERRRAREYDIIALEQADELAGLACFDPHVPGAFPFCARDPASAHTLLNALQPLVPTHPRVQVVVEDHPELARALVAAGGQIQLEMLHMRGPLQ